MNHKTLPMIMLYTMDFYHTVDTNYFLLKNEKQVTYF